MKTILIIFLLIIFSLTLPSCNSPSNQNSISSIQASQIKYRDQVFDIVKVDLEKTNLYFFWKNNNGKKLRSIQNLKNQVENSGKKLTFAMNAGMYLRDGTPKGLYIENGKVIQPLDTLQEGYGNFYLQPNGVFYISKNQKTGVIPSVIFSQKNIKAEWATQSGPMLLIDGKVHQAFREGSTNLNIRNGVGIISETEIAFAISQKEVNLFDFAMLFQEKLNCTDALYLDGFVSRAYIPALQRYDLDGNFGTMISVTE